MHDCFAQKFRTHREISTIGIVIRMNDLSIFA